MKNKITPSNLIATTYHLLDEMKVSYSKNYVESFLRDHKDYPSMSSVVALLNDFNIDNVAVRLNFEKLSGIPLPVIIYLNDESGRFVVLKTVSPESVTFFDSQHGVVVDKISDFNKKWSGAVLIAQKADYSKSTGNDEALIAEEQKRSSSVISSILAVMAVAALVILHPISWTTGTLLILNAIGIALSVFLLSEELGIESKVIDSVCTVGGLKKSNSCRKVSNSKAASIFGIKMSEIGLFYFTGGLITLLVIIVTQGSNLLSGVYMLVLATLPYTLFSIYYQIKVIKDFCPLCLGVIAVLWCECVVLQMSGVPMLPLQVQDAAALIVFNSVPVLIWLALRQNIYNGAATPFIRKQLKIFKSSAEALEGSLMKFGQGISFDVNDKIVINEDGHVTVRAVLSFFCASCGVALQDIITLSQQNEAIRFEIIFFTGEVSSDNIARSMLTKKYHEGNEGAIQFAKNWYNGIVDDTIDYNKVRREAMADIQVTIDSWGKFLLENNINTTPTIFIDGYRKPNGIGILDYKVLFEAKVGDLQPAK